MFDLDCFKSINDKFGHGTGDEVLVMFCRLAAGHLRANDLFGRIGGEEFACLLPNTTLQDAFGLAERIRGAVELASYPVGENTVRVTVSVGVASSNCTVTDLAGLLRKPTKRSTEPRKLVATAWKHYHPMKPTALCSSGRTS